MIKVKQDYNPKDKCLDMKEYQVKTCKWALNTTEKDPHKHQPMQTHKKIYNDTVELIGNTPMVRLNNIPKSEGIKCEMLAKCEFYNPGGSTKDRIGRKMVEGAVEDKKIKKGDTLIEATSGNTGIGVALTGAVRGFEVIITLPEKMSQEKSDVLNALGATIIRTPTEAESDTNESHLGQAILLNKEIPNSLIPDQYINPNNSLAHYDGTAEEIYNQCDGKLDYVIVSAGTGGCITGIARKLKELDKNIQIVGVDPHGSILAKPDDINEKEKGLGYKIEGIGYDFVPKNCDRDTPDHWIKTYDKDSFVMARRLIKEEGLLCGGSSGCTMSAAVEFCKNIPEGKRVVVLLVDSIRNYMTKHLSDDWMIESGFYDQDVVDKDLVSFGENKPIRDYIKNFKEIKSVKDTDSVKEVLESLDKQGVDSLSAVSEKGDLIGMVSLRQISNFLFKYSITKDKPVKKTIMKDFKKLTADQPAKYLTKAFNRYQHVLVIDGDKHYIAEPKDMLKEL